MHNASNRSAPSSPPPNAIQNSVSQSAPSSPSTPTMYNTSRTAPTTPPSVHNINMALTLQYSDPRPNTTPKYLPYTPCPPHLRPHSPLHPSNWKILLEGYPDPEYINNIIGIATHG